jgi:hypothetical protein
MQQVIALPELPYAEWRPTYETLHLWTQIIGKIRLALMPWVNHTWHVTLHPTARGLGTGRMGQGDKSFEIDFDFVAHELQITTDDGESRVVPLKPMTVAVFYELVMATLAALGLRVRINPKPSEIEDAVPFTKDTRHHAYDRAAVERWWRIVAWTSDIFLHFRSRFYGKVSPVHFFWGGFDLAVTRFSGRPAPPHPSTPLLPDRVTQDAYSHEVSSAGFWPGGPATPAPVFYSYAYPEPLGYAQAAVQPAAARYDPALGEFLLPYDAARTSGDPAKALRSFLDSTYVAAAELGHWDRRSLEVPVRGHDR